MSPDTVSAIANAFAPVAAKIGQGAQYGWDIVVAQQRIIGVTDFIYAGALFLGTMIVLIVGYMSGRRFFAHGGAANDQEGWLFLAIGSFVVAFFLCGQAVFEVIDGIQHYLNPSYFAIQFFLGLVR